jgi:hypothetical protein
MTRLRQMAETGAAYGTVLVACVVVAGVLFATDPGHPERLRRLGRRLFSV